jgi:hypothetical protein
VAGRDGLRRTPAAGVRSPDGSGAGDVRTAVDLGRDAPGLVEDVLAEFRPDEPASLAAIRSRAGRSAVLRRLWDEAAAAGVLRSRWFRSRGRMWLAMATYLTAVATPLSFAFVAARQDPPPTPPVGVAFLLVVGAIGGPFAILAFAEWRRGRLPGYGTDPRTPAGLRAVETARGEPWAAGEPWVTALDGPTAGAPGPRSGWWIAPNPREKAGDDGTGWVDGRLDGDGDGEHDGDVDADAD